MRCYCKGPITSAASKFCFRWNAIACHRRAPPPSPPPRPHLPNRVMCKYPSRSVFLVSRNPATWENVPNLGGSERPESSMANGPGHKPGRPWPGRPRRPRPYAGWPRPCRPAQAAQAICRLAQTMQAGPGGPGHMQAGPGHAGQPRRSRRYADWPRRSRPNRQGWMIILQQAISLYKSMCFPTIYGFCSSVSSVSQIVCII